jgi:hypothetical protein
VISPTTIPKTSPKINTSDGDAMIARGDAKTEVGERLRKGIATNLRRPNSTPAFTYGMK